MVKNLPANTGDAGDSGLIPGSEDPWWRKWQPTPVFLPEKISWTEEPGRLQSVYNLYNLCLQPLVGLQSRMDTTEHAPVHNGYVVLLKIVSCPLPSCVR